MGLNARYNEKIKHDRLRHGVLRYAQGGGRIQSHGFRLAAVISTTICLSRTTASGIVRCPA
jgi:hypothetical protein